MIDEVDTWVKSVSAMSWVTWFVWSLMWACWVRGKKGDLCLKKESFILVTSVLEDHICTNTSMNSS